MWIRWKCEQITEFVVEVSSFVHAYRHPERSEGSPQFCGDSSVAALSQNDGGGCKSLGLFAVPWKESDFNGAIKSVIGQDFEQLVKYVDVFSSMTYHKMCHRPVSWISDYVIYLSKLTQKPILPLVQTEDKPSELLAEEFKSSITVALKPPSEGVIIFFLEDLLKNGGKVEVVKEALKR